MKKGIFFVLVIVSLVGLNISTGEASEWWADYPYGDASLVYDRFSWDGFNHAVITWNDIYETASVIQMDPDGVPNMYYFVDCYDTYCDLYYSFTGYDYDWTYDYSFDRWYY